MKGVRRNRIIVGLLMLTNLFALLHYAHNFSAFHELRALVSVAGILVFMVAQGFYLYRPTKLISTAILLAAIASMGFHIAWEIFDETALAGLFLNLQYFIRPGSVLETLGIGDHEAFGVMLEPVVLYGFVLAGMLGLIPGVKHDFKKAKPTSGKGEFIHNPSRDRNGEPLPESGTRSGDHLYHVYAAIPARSASFSAWGYAYMMLAFLVFWGTGTSFTNSAFGFIIGLLAVVGFYFLLFKTHKDTRVKAHDTWFWFNRAHLITPENIKADSNLDIPLRDVTNFYVRPTMKADGSYIEATFTPANSTHTALVAGVGGEYFLGTSVMPGSVGLATGAIGGVASGAANAASGLIAVLMNGIHRASAQHKVKIAEHSFVVELCMRDGKRHVIAGGLSEETASKLMNEVADKVAEDRRAFLAEVEQRTKEQRDMYG